MASVKLALNPLVFSKRLSPATLPTRFTPVVSAVAALVPSYSLMAVMPVTVTSALVILAVVLPDVVSRM